VGQTGILDWYTILVGVVALTALTMHGATWLALKTEGELQESARRCGSFLWWLVALFTVVITLVSFHLLPQLRFGFRVRPWGAVFPALAVAGLLGIKWSVQGKHGAAAFGASCVYLTGMLTSVAFNLYPNVLPSNLNPIDSLTVANAKAADYGLRIGLLWWVIGMALAACYTIFTYRHFAGKIRAAETDEGGY
jgi:cytochrome d ubiquinol oxidase subunit II